MATAEQQNARHRQLVAGYYETGNEALLGELLTELRVVAVGYARYQLRLRDGERAEDLAQDVLLELLELLRRHGFNLARPGSLTGLLCLRCRSRHIDALRQLSGQPSRPSAAENPFLLLGSAVAIQPDELPVSLEAETEASTALTAATEAVLSLDAHARAAVVLHYYQCLPVPEAAARLGLDEHQYRTRLGRGVAALQTWGQAHPHPSGEVYAALPYLNTGDLFTEPLRLAS